MILSPQKRVELQVLYTSIGKLPKIGGRYLSNRKSTESCMVRQPKQEKRGITTIDIESAKKRLYFELRRNSLKHERHQSDKSKRQRFKTEGNEKIEILQRHKRSIRLDQIHLSQSPESTDQGSVDRPRYPYLRRRQQHPQQNQIFACVSPKKNKQKETSVLTYNSHSSSTPLKIRFNECEVEQLDSNEEAGLFGRVQTQAKCESLQNSERMEKKMMRNRRNNLLERLKQKYSEYQMRQEEPAKQQQKAYEPPLFKRYQEASVEYSRCYTEEIKQKLRRH